MRSVVASALFTLYVLLLLTHAVVNDPRPISLKVSPQVGFAPLTLRIQVRVHPIDSDRWIQVLTDNGEFRRVSSFTIEADRALYSWTWQALPAGEYLIEASIGGERVRASDSQRVQIAGTEHPSISALGFFVPGYHDY